MTMVAAVTGVVVTVMTMVPVVTGKVVTLVVTGLELRSDQL